MFFVIALISCKGSSNKNEKSGDVNPIETANSLDTTKLAKGTIFYQSPMDLEVISDKPGSCPKCGMDLEQVMKQ